MGWTWRYIDEEVDIPMVQALSRYWRQFPPAQVQLARIAAWMGYKPSREQEAAPAQATNTDAAEYLGSLPTGPKPKIMSAEEYLAQRAINVQQ